MDRLRLVSWAEPRAEAHEFVSGEPFARLGRHYRLKLKPLKVPGALHLERRFVVLLLTLDLTRAAQAMSVERALGARHIDRDGQERADRIEFWASRVGVEVPQFFIMDQQGRCGNCDQAGLIRPKCNNIQAPMRVDHNVVAHELDLLMHTEHTKVFWGRLGQAMPYCDRRTEDLRRSGPRLKW